MSSLIRNSTKEVHNKVSKAAKTNIILFIICLGLSLLAWFQPGLHQSVVNYLSDLKAEEIHHIIIERQGLETIKINKQNNHWFLSEPYPLPANKQRVATITALAEKRSFSQFQVADDKLFRYHLDEPLVSVWLNGQQFIIGDKDPLNHLRYAINVHESEQLQKQTGSNSYIIHMIADTVFYQLRANLNNFIARGLLAPRATIDSITWIDKKLDKTLTIEQGKWSLIPDNPDISADSIAQLVQFWERAQASRVEINSSLSSDSSLSSGFNVQTDHAGKKVIISLNKGKSSIVFSIIREKIQGKEQIKLLREDVKIAYWITTQQLKQLTEFIF